MQKLIKLKQQTQKIVQFNQKLVNQALENFLKDLLFENKYFKYQITENFAKKTQRK